MQNNTTIVETATALLQQTLKKVRTVYGEAAQQLAAHVREQMRLVKHASEAARTEGSYNSHARSAVSTADRSVSEAEATLRQLDERGRYTGPLRGKMTVDEKTAYIKKHSEAEFLALPW